MKKRTLMFACMFFMSCMTALAQAESLGGASFLNGNKTTGIRPMVFAGQGLTWLSDKFLRESANGLVVTKDSWMGGAGCEVPLVGNLLLVPQLQLSWSSYHFNNIAPVTRDFHLWWLQVPVLADYRIGLGRHFSLDVGAGPYAGFRLNNNAAGPDFKSVDCGLCFKVGGLICRHFLMEVKLQAGLPDLSDEAYSSYTYRLSGIIGNIGYRF